MSETATTASATTSSAHPHGSSQFVVFALGGAEYALPIEKVQEVIRYQQPRSVTAEEPWITGVISLRGKIIPVCDLSLRLGQQPNRREDAKIVIVDATRGTAGIIVDEVDEVLTADSNEVDEPPAAAASSIEAIAKVDERLILVLDAEQLFGDFTADAFEE